MSDTPFASSPSQPPPLHTHASLSNQRGRDGFGRGGRRASVLHQDARERSLAEAAGGVQPAKTKAEVESAPASDSTRPNTTTTLSRRR
jgi:hypothetical protein